MYRPHSKKSAYPNYLTPCVILSAIVKGKQKSTQ